MDEIFNDYITNHNKKFDFLLVINDFKLVFDKEFYTHIKSELQHNTILFHLERFLLHWIEFFNEIG